jgi:hypothetical protein
MKRIIATVVAVLACSASAMADLNGTNTNLSVNHAGAFSAISAVNNQNYAFGNASGFVAPGWGTLNVTTPAAPVGFANALKLDFTPFGYAAFLQFPTTGTFKLLNLAETPDLGSVTLLINGVSMGSGVGAETGGFHVSWSTTNVLAANPVTPSVTVAWNSVVPAPGAMALLGLAGMVGLRGRNRRRCV